MIIKPTQSQFNVWFSKWISIRKSQNINIDLRDYQPKMLWDVIEHIGAGKSSLSNTNKFVLSACPNAGKTLMAIIYIDWCLYLNSELRVVVLTHGQINLKTQFMDEAEKYQADFLNSKNIIIDIPQGLYKRELPKIDLLVVDEEHQFYFAEMMQKVINKIKPNQQLLMTGTPATFIAHNIKYPNDQFDMNFIDVKTLFDMNFANNVHVEVASTTYNFGMNAGTFNPYYKGGDLIGEKIPKDEIYKMMTYIMDLKRSRLKLNPILYKNKILNTVTTPFKKDVAKTMIVVRNRDEARLVYEYLIEDGYSKNEVMLSISNDVDCDPDLKPFKENQDIKFLVVVFRGILGFNYSELANIVDLTCSWNINRIFQLYCRLLRKSDTIETKFYYKVVPEQHIHFFHDFMVAVLHLCHKHFLKMYNGTNFLNMPIRYKGDELPKIKSLKNINDKTTKTTNVKVLPIFDLETVFELNRLYHKGGVPCESKYYGKLSDHIDKLSESERNNWNKKTTEELLNIAKLNFQKNGN